MVVKKMNCPKCNNEVKKTHEQYWCSKCFIGFTRPVDLEEFISEIVLKKQLIPTIKQMIDEKTGLELLDYVIEHLATSLYPDPFHIMDCLVIARNNVVNKKCYMK